MRGCTLQQVSMAKKERIAGVLAPVITPFKPDYTPDAGRFVRHCRWLLKSGCAGLAVFGTNSEANSMSVPEKRRLLEALAAGGVSPAALMPGTGHCALPDSIELTRAAVELGCAGVLMLPPFYYKGVSDEGLYRNFAEVIERVGDERLALYLYHIPPVSQVPITLNLIEKLLSKYPGIVAGVKDSSGNWANTKAMLESFAKSGFDVFAGSEEFLLENMRNGGKGCITATGNINPGPIDRVFRSWRSADAERQQAGITATRKIVQKQPMIPALKATVAHFANDPQWKTCRPPLVELTSAQEETLFTELKASGFSMPGLA
jgi:4-hydroxy-tetrahydrodipicolinate synthase